MGDASAELVVRLYPGVEMGTEELSGNPGKILGGNLAME